MIDLGFRPLFPSQARLVRPAGARPQGPRRLLSSGHGGPVGQGGGWLLHGNQRWFRLKGLGRGGWGALPSWPNPEGGVLRCPVIAARSARSLDAAAPRPPPLPPRPGTGPFPVLASQLQSVLQKLKFSAGYWVGPQVRQGPGRGLTICSRTCSMPHRKSGASAVETAHQCLVVGLGLRCPCSSALLDIGNCCRYFKKIGQPV